MPSSRSLPSPSPDSDWIPPVSDPGTRDLDLDLCAKCWEEEEEDEIWRRRRDSQCLWYLLRPLMICLSFDAFFLIIYNLINYHLCLKKTLLNVDACRFTVF